jgi:hypothetical protein
VNPPPLTPRRDASREALVGDNADDNPPASETLGDFAPNCRARPRTLADADIYLIVDTKTVQVMTAGGSALETTVGTDAR